MTVLVKVGAGGGKNCRQSTMAFHRFGENFLSHLGKVFTVIAIERMPVHSCQVNVLISVLVVIYPDWIFCILMGSFRYAKLLASFIEGTVLLVVKK